jgi:N-acetylglucosaminyldiphosphoundecaprenol N-acetyl-beta-D-mannosaminyltransferase
MRRNVAILGVNFIDQPFEAALAQLFSALDDRIGRTVFFANAATLNFGAEDETYRDTLNSADFLYGDGTGVRWAALARGVKLQSNLNGTDLIPALIARTPGIRVFLLGGRDEMIARAAERFHTHFPEAVLAGHRNGYFPTGENEQVCDAINAAKPDLVLVGMGNPLQEKWLAENRARIKAPLAAAVGGLFSYWAGTLTRAPKVFRSLGMEWVHIMLRQPHKTRRYLIGNPLFIWRIFSWLAADLSAQTAQMRPLSHSRPHYE